MILNGLTQTGGENNMLYVLILSTRGNEEVVFATDNKMEACKREDALRKECRRVDPDGVEMDCYVRTEKELKNIEEAKARWNE